MTIQATDIADVFDKVADYIEAIETKKLANIKEEKTKAASALASKIADVTGEQFDDEIIEKLSGLNPEISEIVEKLAGSGAVDSMGGPQENATVKTASAGVSSAEQNFCSWLMSD
jgi:hypothetical protein